MVLSLSSNSILQSLLPPLTFVHVSITSILPLLIKTLIYPVVYLLYLLYMKIQIQIYGVYCRFPKEDSLCRECMVLSRPSNSVQLPYSLSFLHLPLFIYLYLYFAITNRKNSFIHLYIHYIYLQSLIPPPTFVHVSIASTLP